MQFRKFLRLSSLSIAWLVACACSDSSGGHVQPSQSVVSKRASDGHRSSGKNEGGEIGNPLGIPYLGLERTESMGGQVHCVQLRLGIKDEKYSKYLSGDLMVANQCDSAIAVMVSPVEIYYRRNESEFFVNETLIEPVYVDLYIFKADLGISPQSFLGDGGLEVYGWPDYATIAAHTSVRIQLIDKQGIRAKLPPGDYGSVISTWVAASSSRPHSASFIDLGMNVDRFNRERRSERIGIRPDADSLTSTVSTFHVSSRTE